MAWWFWVILGLALLGLELAMPGGFFLVFFGLSAIIVGVATLLLPQMTAWVAWLSFSLISIVLLVAFRQRLIRAATGKSDPIDSLVGQEVELSEDIAPGEQGAVVLRGAPWRATNCGTLPLTSGSRSKVSAVDGLTLKIG